jgi:hypothetical protein
MVRQTAIAAVRALSYDDAAERLRDVAGQVVERLGAVEVAGMLGVGAAALHMALTGREKRSVKLDWLPALLDMDREGHLIRALCTLAGGQFVANDRRTDAERLLALKEQVEKFGEAGLGMLRAAGLK